jgi:hypothetical protein
VQDALMFPGHLIDLLLNGLFQETCWFLSNVLRVLSGLLESLATKAKSAKIHSSTCDDILLLLSFFEQVMLLFLYLNFFVELSGLNISETHSMLLFLKSLVLDFLINSS